MTTGEGEAAVASETREDQPFRPDWADRSRTTRLVWRIGVAVVGGAVLIGGIILIPYPGPGWLVVFAGLAILAVEFPWARRVLDYARAKYDGWVAWLKRQNLAVRLLVLALTGLIVVVTLWLLGVVGLMGRWFEVDWSWLRSPLLG